MSRSARSDIAWLAQGMEARELLVRFCMMLEYSKVIWSKFLTSVSFVFNGLESSSLIRPACFFYEVFAEMKLIQNLIYLFPGAYLTAWVQKIRFGSSLSPS